MRPGNFPDDRLHARLVFVAFASYRSVNQVGAGYKIWTMVGSGKKNRFFTRSTVVIPCRGDECDAATFTPDRVICIFCLAPGGGAGKLDFFRPDPDCRVSFVIV